jgi:ribosomal protein S14
MRKHRDKLMAADPHCQNCGTGLVHFTPRPHQPVPDNFATLEHVNSRNQSRPRPPVGRTVLWCRRCNQDRGAAEQAALGIDRLRELAGRPGGRHPDGSYRQGRAA